MLSPPRCLLLLVSLPACSQARPGQAESDKKTLLECRAPDGSIASFFIASGGGAAGWAYEHVSVTPKAESVPSDVLVLKGAYDVHMVWQNATTLKIQVPEDVRIDHWQSWFGRSAQGRIYLELLPPRGNTELADSGSCAPAA